MSTLGFKPAKIWLYGLPISNSASFIKPETSDRAKSAPCATWFFHADGPISRSLPGFTMRACNHLAQRERILNAIDHLDCGVDAGVPDWQQSDLLQDRAPGHCFEIVPMQLLRFRPIALALCQVESNVEPGVG